MGTLGRRRTGGRGRSMHQLLRRTHAEATFCTAQGTGRGRSPGGSAEGRGAGEAACLGRGRSMRQFCATRALIKLSSRHRAPATACPPADMRKAVEPEMPRASEWGP